MPESKSRLLFEKGQLRNVPPGRWHLNITFPEGSEDTKGFNNLLLQVKRMQVGNSQGEKDRLQGISRKPNLFPVYSQHL